ncbi:hypothetical protein [Ruminococcus sp. Marseille-P6503]|uniref:hypothetical protein n=1 Tax=Ruminococcus sp. Marseille-P6503 TaxID=2364796 RepID=UPI000F529A79|nr:hypothetical protein [Ruminococcus sp. Marseille-P6503]
MKLKRLLAGVLAGCLAVGSAVSAVIVSSADDEITVKVCDQQYIAKAKDTGYQFSIKGYPRSENETATIKVEFTGSFNGTAANAISVKFGLVNPNNESEIITIAQNYSGMLTELPSEYGTTVTREVSLYDLMRGALAKEPDIDVNSYETAVIFGASTRPTSSDGAENTIDSLTIVTPYIIEDSSSEDDSSEIDSSLADDSSTIDSSAPDDSSVVDPGLDTEFKVYKEIDLENHDLGTGWSNTKEITADNFADAKAGDIVTIDFSQNSDVEYWQLKIMDGSGGWPVLSGPSESGDRVVNDYDCVELLPGDTSYSFRLTEADVTALQANGMMLGGYGVTLSKLSIASPATDDSSSDVSSDVSSETSDESSDTDSETSDTDVSSESEAAQSETDNSDSSAESAAESTASKADTANTTASKASSGASSSDSSPKTGSVAGGISAAAIVCLAAVAAIKKKNG